jgi:diguanylate cyclase (GGDEF)-like protein
LDEGPCVEAYQTGQTISIPDLREESRFPRFVAAALNAGLAAVFTFPLGQNDRRLGALDLYRTTPGPLDEEAMTVAQTMADVVSAYLVNAKGRSDLLDSTSRAHAVSLHDALTGLPNRILLLELIESALLAKRRSGRHVAILFIDLDGFKKVNDVSGHQVGDDLLIATSDRITHLLRPGDALARLAGDEFVVVCEGLDHEFQIDVVAERIVGAISMPFDLDGTTIELSASIGIAFAGEGHNPEEILHNADVAMYQVKRKGGANFQVIDTDEQQMNENSDSLKRDLGFAVGRHELRLDYQPVVRMSDGRVDGLEALLRWDHPQRGLIPPAILIPLAETSGAIVKIGQWVLENACLDRHRWAAHTGDQELVLAVNVSAHQLMSPEFVAMVESTLSATRTMPHQLCLEITESSFIQDAERAHSVLGQLKTLGVQVALDDFGTGYSSLSYLMEYPVDVVKIDRSFIAKLLVNDASRAIVSATIDLAHALKLLVVCEGVESAEQDREVNALTSDYCQGFYFSHPLSVDDLDELISQTISPWTITVPEPV